MTFDDDVAADVAAIGLTFDLCDLNNVIAVAFTFDDDVIAAAFTLDDDVITEALTLEAGTPFFFAGIGAADFTE